MSYGLVGLYGIFLIFVGINGNAKALKDSINGDGKGFMIWILAILILRALYSVDAIKPVVKPFIALALLTFVLKNYSLIVRQVNQITGSHFKEV